MKRCVDPVMRTWKSSMFSHFSSDDSACGSFDSSKHTLGKPLPNLKSTAANPVEDEAISSIASEDDIFAAAVEVAAKVAVAAEVAAAIEVAAEVAVAAKVAAEVAAADEAEAAAAAEVAATVEVDEAEVAATAEVDKDAIFAAGAEVDGRERDYKRKGKMAYNWALAVAGFSVALLVTMPHQMEASNQIIPYTCSATFACLSLITSIGLIYYSILSTVGATLAWVQVIVMRFSIVFLLCAVIFRVAAVFRF